MAVLLLAVAVGEGETSIVLFWVNCDELDEVLMFWATVMLELLLLVVLWARVMLELFMVVVLLSLSSSWLSLSICSTSN